MVSSKRKQTNRAGLIRAFSPLKFVNPNRHEALSILPPEELIKFMQFYLEHRYRIEDILAYARRFKQAVGELEVDDIEAVKNMFLVRSLMEE